MLFLDTGRAGKGSVSISDHMLDYVASTMTVVMGVMLVTFGAYGLGMQLTTSTTLIGSCAYLTAGGSLALSSSPWLRQRLVELFLLYCMTDEMRDMLFNKSLFDVLTEPSPWSTFSSLIISSAFLPPDQIKQLQRNLPHECRDAVRPGLVNMMPQAWKEALLDAMTPEMKEIQAKHRPIVISSTIKNIVENNDHFFDTLSSSFRTTMTKNVSDSYKVMTQTAISSLQGLLFDNGLSTSTLFVSSMAGIALAMKRNFFWGNKSIAKLDSTMKAAGLSVAAVSSTLLLCRASEINYFQLVKDFSMQFQSALNSYKIRNRSRNLLKVGRNKTLDRKYYDDVLDSMETSDQSLWFPNGSAMIRASKRQLSSFLSHITSTKVLAISVVIASAMIAMLAIRTKSSIRNLSWLFRSIQRQLYAKFMR